MTTFYTVGDITIYDEILNRNPDGLVKKGKDINYKGGIIFTSLEAAKNNCNDYRIYIIDTDFDNLHYTQGNYHLIKAAKILGKAEI